MSSLQKLGLLLLVFITAQTSLAQSEGAFPEPHIALPQRNTTLRESDTPALQRDTSLAQRKGVFPEPHIALPQRNTTLRESDTPALQRNTSLAQRKGVFPEPHIALPQRNTSLRESDAPVLRRNSPVAQSTTLPKKLPSAEKIVDNYLKAIGGKKAAAALKDTTYEWIVHFNNEPIGTARTQRKAPSSERFELTFGNGQVVYGANARSAWEVGLDNRLRTLSGSESAAAKLRAALDATRLVNFKKSNVLARVVSLGDLASEPAYIVEFSMKSGARFQYYFSVKTSLITKITGDVKKTRVLFDDYRASKGLLEPHRVKLNLGGSGDLTLLLQSVKYDTGLEDRVFDPPTATENLDVAALLREVGKNQDEIDNRVAEYAFKQTETDREISSKGELKKQTVKAYEVFPLPNREPVKKLISENGVPLSTERAAKEDRRVNEEFLKAEREKDEDEKKAARRRAEREKKSKEEGTEISPFLKACEFVSPRKEMLEGRETIVFDFRPRPGFRPQNREESLIAKLIGVIWIDPIDKQVIRLEARLAEGFKIAGGLVASLKPGAALVIEQTRMAQGVWLPRFAQVNLSVKVLLFGGGDYNKTVEWSDYKHFSGDVKDYKLDAPAKP